VYLLLAGTLPGNPANGDVRLERLFSMFIAPCCWRENLLAHHSPEADALRSEIRKRVADGERDEEIKAVLLARYTGRILSEPEGGKGQWLTWTPLAVGAAGLAIVCGVVKRLAAKPPAGPATEPLVNLGEEWDD